ncbi:MAG: hypothetical protein WCG25_05350 [bacterium]
MYCHTLAVIISISNNLFSMKSIKFFSQNFQFNITGKDQNKESDHSQVAILLNHNFAASSNHLYKTNAALTQYILKFSRESTTFSIAGIISSSLNVAINDLIHNLLATRFA